MKAESVIRHENSQIRTYKNIMSSIEFMQKFLSDPDIFISGSISFRNFLIQSFCYLHSDFHYLSFLNKEDVDLEIIKVACILQILPSNIISKSSRLFDTMSKDEINKFWLKFFTLFKKQNDSAADSIFSIGWENKINFFKDMESTLNYLNYEFPIINSDRLNGADITKEIDIWKEQIVSTDMVLNESTFLHYNERKMTSVNIENLILYLEQIVSLYSNILTPNLQSKLQHTDYFINFISHTKNILQYRNNLKIINSKLLDELNCKFICNDKSSLENLCFIKRCNYFIKVLKSKIKILGSNQFQREYIEYLQERNTELLNRLNHMKENYENKILSKDINKHYLISILEDILSVCTVIPQELDLFFDKMTAAMGAFKNILLRKSEMVQLVEKISKAVNPENFNNDMFAMATSGLIKEHISDERTSKKGTVKVSPMINGHIISTEPRIYLNRVPGVYTPGRQNGIHQLSPIIEASPSTSSDPSSLENHIFKEIKIPLERINLNKMSFNYVSEQESPKSRFKGPKTWKKSLSSTKHQSENKKNAIVLENNENLNKKLSLEEVENTDPLEGPSWLYEESSEMISSASGFSDYRRRKHRFATVFDKNEGCIAIFEKNIKKSLKNSSNELFENHITDDEKEDFEGIKKRVSESPEDFISESIINECDKNYSSLRRCQNSERDDKISTNLNDYVEFKNFKKEIVISSSKNKKSTVNAPVYSDSSAGDSNENFIRMCKKNKKFNEKELSKSSLETVSTEFFFEKSPNEMDTHNEQKAYSSERSKDGKKKSALIKAALENGVFVKLEDCMAAAEVLPNVSVTKNSKEKKKFKRSKSRSPTVLLSKNEGRKKRKAAPSFKLVEPKLGTKLRRS